MSQIISDYKNCLGLAENSIVTQDELRVIFGKKIMSKPSALLKMETNKMLKHLDQSGTDETVLAQEMSPLVYPVISLFDITGVIPVVDVFLEENTEAYALLWQRIRSDSALGEDIIVVYKIVKNESRMQVEYGYHSTRLGHVDMELYRYIIDTQVGFCGLALLVSWISNKMKNKQELIIQREKPVRKNKKSRNRKSDRGSITNFSLSLPKTKICYNNLTYKKGAGTPLEFQRYVPEHIHTFNIKRENIEKYKEKYESQGRDFCILEEKVSEKGTVPLLLKLGGVLHRPDLPKREKEINVKD